MANRPVSSLTKREFLDHRVRKQFAGKLSHPCQSVLTHRPPEFDLERLPLTDPHYVRVPKSLACTRDCRTLWIVNLRFEPHVNDDPAHSSAFLTLGYRPCTPDRSSPLRVALSFHGHRPRSVFEFGDCGGDLTGGSPWTVPSATMALVTPRDLPPPTPVDGAG
jgi:hypothetical protein